MSSDAMWSDSMPALYDRDLGPALFEPFAQLMTATAAELGPQNVLELAAGTGIVTRALTERLPEAQITATDLNTAMVDYARPRVPTATWQVADAQDLPFPDESFDLVLCQFGVMFFPDRVGAYREARRVLRPGGAFLFAVWDRVETMPLTADLQQAIERMFPQDPPQWMVRVPYGYADPEQISADVVAAGFAAARIERVTPQGQVSSPASYVRGATLGSPLRAELQARGPLEATADALAAEITERWGEAPIPMDLAGYLVTATG